MKKTKRQKIIEVLYKHQNCTLKGQDWFQKFEFTDCKGIIIEDLIKLLK